MCSQLANYKQLNNYHSQSSDKCDKCKNIIGNIFEISKDPKNEAAVQYSIEHVCSTISGFLAGVKCRIFIRWNKVKVFNFILENPDVQVVCAKLKKCTINLVDL